MNSKRTVLVTGCSDGGIGAELAKEYHSRGLRVFASSRRLETMKEIAALGIETISLDVTSIDSIRMARDAISSQTGGNLDILVNNAGQVLEGAAVDLEISASRALFEINVIAPMAMVQEFFPILMAGTNACIVNIGSGSGLLPIPLQSSYNASKAAFHSWSDTLRVELKPFDISVVTVVTNTVKSNIRKPVHFPDNSLYKPMEAIYNVVHDNIDRDAEPTDKYARMVVTQTTKSKPRGWLWGGHLSTLLWVMLTFFPRRVPEKIVLDMYKFNEFSTQVRKDRAKERA